MSDSLKTKSKEARPSGLSVATAPAGLRWTAIIAGLIGFLCFIATPLLPVNQTQSSFDWPQNDSLQSINAPLISVAPENLEATIPMSAVDELRDGQNMVYSTVPPESKKASNRGLFVRSGDDGLSVVSLDEVLLTLSAKEVAQLSDDAQLHISATGDGTTVSVGKHKKTTEDDLRPQVTGVYTELKDDANVQSLVDDGLNIHVDINSRFTSSPSLIKSIAMWLGVAMVIVSLFCLWRIDRLDGQKLRFMPETWKKIRPLDGVVAAVLGFWYIFGANTSDDGFIFSMSRVFDNATYMANYYRWYGVPEAPFGSPYYDLVALLSQISAASVFVRLPGLISGLIIWFILSREMLPRFGDIVDARRVSHWTAALMFLAFWLPYNNGTRPEPIVALGVMVTWASFERALATHRLLPAAVGTIAATITLAAGPTGLFAVGVFLVSLPHLFRAMAARVPAMGGGATGWLSLVAPFLASGTAIIVAAFGDQTLASVAESTRVRSEVGPSLPWYSEYARYSTLFQESVDGSLTRRFAVLTMLFCLVLILAAFIKDRRVIGAAVGPTQRLLIIVALSMFFLMFTPTKWTHHFGIYAGVAGVIAALAAVVLSRFALRSPRARTFSIAAVLFLLAISFAGWNAWWYVSSFGIPWWDRTVQLKGVEANSILLAISLVVLAVGVVQSLRHSHRKLQAQEEGTEKEFKQEAAAKVSRSAGIMSAPIAVACAIVVAFSMASFAKSTVAQADSYSVGKGNLASLRGDTCSLANETLVETNTNDSFLTPVDGDLGDSLVDKDESSNGFGPNNIPESIEPEDQDSASVGAIGDSSQDSDSTSQDDATAGTDKESGGDSSDSQETRRAGKKASETTDTSEGGVRGTQGVNGSTMHLPFNLDYTTVPVLGSYTESQESLSQVTTKWYHLPETTENTPVLAVSAAGKIYHHDVNDVEQEGMELTLEYGTIDENGKVTDKGEEELSDVGATPKWRNLRLPMDKLPEEANVVRLVAEDDFTDEDDWLAFTPPRVPELDTINNQFPAEKPALLDWSVALQFPCQRTFDHYAGVTEIPEYRILPDAAAQTSLTDFQSFSGGGAMSTAEAVNYSYEIPSYLNNDWARDWGAIEKYELRTDSQGNTPAKAEIDYEDVTRSGLWKESEMKIRPEGEQ
ncbi:arabinosyltransferase domain-containing protein [Corynebacterium rhinophilum]|uniref:arabinosyltransferase domain-containing protein n=1 Tax=Corynebacterium rhinophilum TaxID=3050197 RepID=UPI002550879D|nr:MULTISPECIES: arabinosyltransferase domain-containing protein [unclassified Corynebacterium]MDK8453282.1 arabinosyltransferase domain-containing protein [Corynebacterium sp. MSK084]MDK8515212.1 arabinosyltransferase domain-containing protein [Corynebacterium sp. MSK123]MDK8548438.1 arabinosyltransferase domain-containing protein [Corynebacterium sp. MSK222]